MKDTLGDRMKRDYEDRTRLEIPRRTYTIIRVDGKAFHTLTKQCQRPYDQQLMDLMDQTAIALCKEIQGAVFGFVQSDEISIVLTDFKKITTNAWFDGNIQKMASIAASCATAAFNSLALGQAFSRPAMFDARVFSIPDRTEVMNYLIWRQQDATRNSLQMAARAVYSHKELEGKNSADLHDLLHAKNINWNNYTSGQKRGRAIVKRQHNASAEHKLLHAFNGPGQAASPDNIIRNKWVSLNGVRPVVPVGYVNANEKAEEDNETPIFTQDKEFLKKIIPVIGEVNSGLEGA